VTLSVMKTVVDLVVLEVTVASRLSRVLLLAVWEDESEGEGEGEGE